MITGLHHLVLFCADTEVSRSWYERAGFTYKRGYHGMHWFALGEAEIMLHPADAAAGRPSTAIHVAVADVDSLFRQADERGLGPMDHQNPGATLTGPVTRPWGDREFELVDPDGQAWAFTQK